MEIGEFATDVEVDFAGDPLLDTELAPEEGAIDGGEELVGSERLGQIVVGAYADASGAVLGVSQGGDHDDGDEVGVAIELEPLAWAAFAAGVLLVRRIPVRWAAPVILLGAIGVQLAALSAPPQGSDDLYRYIWDGRVQAAGIDPYVHSAPAAPQLAFLRDRSPGRTTSPPGACPRVPSCTAPRHGWPCRAAPRLNRPVVHTIYPPVAEAYFYLVHLVSPAGSGTTPVQVAAGDLRRLITGLLLARRAGTACLAARWPCCRRAADRGLAPPNTQGRAETKALGDLRIDIDVGAIPRAIADERGGAYGILGLVGAGQAVRTFIWRVEGRIALRDEGELTVDIPIVACDRPWITVRLRRPVGLRYAELVVEPEPQRLDVEGRLVSRARWKDAGDGSEAVVEI